MNARYYYKNSLVKTKMRAFSADINNSEQFILR